MFGQACLKCILEGSQSRIVQLQFWDPQVGGAASALGVWRLLVQITDKLAFHSKGSSLSDKLVGTGQRDKGTKGQRGQASQDYAPISGKRANSHSAGASGMDAITGAGFAALVGLSLKKF